MGGGNLIFSNEIKQSVTLLGEEGSEQGMLYMQYTGWIELNDDDEIIGRWVNK